MFKPYLLAVVSVKRGQPPTTIVQWVPTLMQHSFNVNLYSSCTEMVESLKGAERQPDAYLLEIAGSNPNDRWSVVFDIFQLDSNAVIFEVGPEPITELTEDVRGSLDATMSLDEIKQALVNAIY